MGDRYRRYSVDVVTRVVVCLYDIRCVYIIGVEAELDICVEGDLKSIVLRHLALVGEIDKTEFDGAKDKVLVAGSHSCAQSLVKLGFVEFRLFGGEERKIREGEGRHFKA